MNARCQHFGIERRERGTARPLQLKVHGINWNIVCQPGRRIAEEHQVRTSASEFQEAWVVTEHPDCEVKNSFDRNPRLRPACVVGDDNRLAGSVDVGQEESQSLTWTRDGVRRRGRIGRGRRPGWGRRRCRGRSPGGSRRPGWGRRVRSPRSRSWSDGRRARERSQGRGRCWGRPSTDHFEPGAAVGAGIHHAHSDMRALGRRDMLHFEGADEIIAQAPGEGQLKVWVPSIGLNGCIVTCRSVNVTVIRVLCVHKNLVVLEPFVDGDDHPEILESRNDIWGGMWRLCHQIAPHVVHLHRNAFAWP